MSLTSRAVVENEASLPLSLVPPDAALPAPGHTTANGRTGSGVGLKSLRAADALDPSLVRTAERNLDAEVDENGDPYDAPTVVSADMLAAAKASLTAASPRPPLATIPDEIPRFRDPSDAEGESTRRLLRGAQIVVSIDGGLDVSDAVAAIERRTKFPVARATTRDVPVVTRVRIKPAIILPPPTPPSQPAIVTRKHKNQQLRRVSKLSPNLIAVLVALVVGIPAIVITLLCDIF